jgi:predicted nucleic acid-binding protein
MQAFDASSMIHAWDNYPVRQFPGMWQWISAQINERRLVMPVVAYAEVCQRTPDCGEWLANANLERLDVTNVIVQDAIRIKGLLGIVGDRYHPKGVGENDILIICTARAHGRELVSDEGRQNVRPELESKRKIPSVCSMPQVGVACINFIDYIKRADFVFG